MGSPRARHPVFLAGTYLVLWCGCILFGGSSRVDNSWLLIQRPVAVICLAVFLAYISKPEARPVRFPLLLLGAVAAIMLVQLMPLPPYLWRALPGRGRYTEALTLAGAGSAWLPISIAPDRGWSSFAALITPVSVLLGYAVVPRWVRELTLPALIIVGLLSALLGLAQISGGASFSLYYYSSSNTGYPIGFLANRNHEGVFLALLIPALRAWSVEGAGGRLMRRPWLAMAAAAFVAPMVFVTGSRSGLALLAVGVLAAYLVQPKMLEPRRSTTLRWVGLVAGLASASLLLAVMLVTGRAVALDRLLYGSTLSDARFGYTPVVWSALRSAFPVGWGFGTFDLVFRAFEPDQMLTLAYANNAHDDLLELLLTGGVAAGLVLGAFFWWFAKRAIATFRAGADPTTARARAAVLMSAMLMFASLTDYPLRSPLLAAVFALLCAWIADRAPERRVATQQLSL